MIDPLVRTVVNMMARFGGDAMLTANTGGVYDYDTSSMVPSVASYAIRVIAEDYIKKESGLTDYHGTMIQTGDRKIYIKPVTGLPTPKVDDVITFQGRKWRIIAMKEHNPSGTNAYLYEAYARQ